MSPLNYTLIEEFKNVVFKKVELEYQDNSTLKKRLTQLVNQDSKSEVKKKTNFRFLRNEQSDLIKKLSIDVLEGI